MSMLPYLFLILFINAKVAAIDHANNSRPSASTKVTGSGGTPAQPSFFSAYSPGAETNESQVTVHCKTLRDINNLNERITIVGNVQEDLVTSVVKIIVPPHTNVIAEGFCHPHTN